MAEVNLGFESGDLTGWAVHQEWGGGEPWQVTVISSHADTQTGALTLPHEGAYMLRLGATFDSMPFSPPYTWMAIVTRDLELKTGQVVSGWFALDSFTAGYGEATVAVARAGQGAIAASYSGGDTTWMPWSYTATLDAVHTFELRITRIGGSETYALFDGIALSEPPPIISAADRRG